MKDSSTSIPRKRVRLGTTRSCSECRRRRVRCSITFPGQACQACLSHNTPCRPQKPSSERIRDETTLPGDEAAILRRRLAEIESQVSSLVGSLNTSQTSDLLQDVARKSRHIAAINLSASNDNAPLMSFMGDAMTIKTLQQSNDEGSTLDDRRMKELLQELYPLLPDASGLQYILTETEVYWSIWPISPPIAKGDRPLDIEAVMRYLPQSFYSNDTFEIAKSMLWLSLCIQQMSQKWNTDTAAESAKHLVKSYMRIANSILSINAEIDQRSIVELECRMLQHTLLINQGKPHKAWLTIRSALNSASLQGLHCLPSIHDNIDMDIEHKRKIWNQISQADILPSLLLGLPAHTPARKSPTVDDGKSDARSVMMKEMFRIANAISDRNRENQLQDYNLTLQLDQEYERCCSMMPIDWWNSTLDDNVPMPIVYQAQRMKLLMGFVGKSIHLPFLVKARNDIRYTQSRNSVFKHSKRMMEAYLALRAHPKTQFVMCELMDFQVFGAALAVAVEMLSASTSVMMTKSYEDIQAESDHWQLVMIVSTVLRQTSIQLDCNVAAQSANVLDNLCTAHQHPERVHEFDAEIPYFGRLHFSPMAKSTHTTLVATSSSTGSNIFDSLPSTPVFTADLFYPLSPTGDFQPPIMDLHDDWTSFDFANNKWPFSSISSDVAHSLS